MTPFPIADNHSIRQLVTFQDQPGDGWREWVGALRIERDKAAAYVADPATHGAMMTDALIDYSTKPSGDFDVADLVDGDVLFMHYETVNEWMNAMRNSWFGGQVRPAHTHGEIPGAQSKWTTASGAKVLIIQTDAVKKGCVLLWRTQNAAATHPTFETFNDDTNPNNVIITARMMYGGADVSCLRWDARWKPQAHTLPEQHWLWMYASSTEKPPPGWTQWSERTVVPSIETGTMTDEALGLAVLDLLIDPPQQPNASVWEALENGTIKDGDTLFMSHRTADSWMDWLRGQPPTADRTEAMPARIRKVPGAAVYWVTRYGEIALPVVRRPMMDDIVAVLHANRPTPITGPECKVGPAGPACKEGILTMHATIGPRTVTYHQWETP